jgi:hypothetical protein
MAIQGISAALDSRGAGNAAKAQPRPTENAQSSDGQKFNETLSVGNEPAGVSPPDAAPQANAGESNTTQLVGGQSAPLEGPAQRAQSLQAGDTADFDVRSEALTEVEADISQASASISLTPTGVTADDAVVTAPPEIDATVPAGPAATQDVNAGVERTEQNQVAQQTEVNALSAQRANQAPAAGFGVTNTVEPASIGSRVDVVA